MHETKDKAKGGVRMARNNLRLTLASPPCGPNCPNRAWDCHKAGHCAPYDDFVAECAELRKKRDMERDVDSAISMAVGRFPGERRV